MITYLANIGSFFLYFISASLLTMAYVGVYTKVTPHDEWELIKKNITAAALAFSGSLLGFIIPLASLIIHAVNLMDLFLWGIVALLVQLLTFKAISHIMPCISERLANNEMAAGIWLAAASVGAGTITAACLTY
ncbi:DUF350 domain-containing protein [Spartinivicinus poritis]|uniref:DUF350 domain-containing protein n=1 Tax=Spartinivicinus poritis TaxID=2994640 RepID=A0ABT5UDM2_9GAMM|nr:DUF350 domain-containing protein [Spartinivicinus sp. A2-2]MDE1464470.1 DUF350 domain-containing protein [Spartinivicinus sp. A2-2]